MLHRVLAALAAADCVDQIAVVSDERDTVPADVMVLPDAGDGLNAALQRAQQWLLERGAREILVLPADLPFLCAEDVEALVRSGRDGGLALAPDAADTGTNGLFWSVELARCGVAAAGAAADPLCFEFGPGSRQRHQAQAWRLGLSAQLVRRPGLAFDVDIAQDLARLAQPVQRDEFDERAHPTTRRTQHA
jgi:2-phospho-L-lactate guanylyltransferase